MLVIVDILGRTDFYLPYASIITDLLSSTVSVIGRIMIIIGVVNFIIAYSYWNGEGWSWILGMILAILGIIIDLTTLPGGIIRIFIEISVIYYLTRPNVKTLFGKKPSY